MTDMTGGDGVREKPALLDIRDAAVHFGGVRAVDGVSMSLSPDKIYGIIGPNGSGKSTLLAAVTRLVPLTRGDLMFEGKSLAALPASRVAIAGISRTFQTVRLLSGLTVRENIELGVDLARGGGSRISRGEAARRVREAMGRVGLLAMESLRPGELSYGTQRRVEIARSIAMQPRLLLLDEPTAGMNQNERAEISELLISLRGEGMTQLLIEHDVQMMVDTCDYVYAMTSGRVIAEGTPAAVVRDPEVQRAYLGRVVDRA
jgi:branched-chain amino acid transport system ATP-binding protein